VPSVPTAPGWHLDLGNKIVGVGSGIRYRDVPISKDIQPIEIGISLLFVVFMLDLLFAKSSEDTRCDWGYVHGTDAVLFCATRLSTPIQPPRFETKKVPLAPAMPTFPNPFASTDWVPSSQVSRESMRDQGL